MDEEGVRAYWDIPANAQHMCDVLMTAHPGWTVRWLTADRTFESVSVWVARREEWPASEPPLFNTNAGLLNLDMTMADGGPVIP